MCHYYHKAYGHEAWQSGDFYEKFKPIKSHNPLNTWSRDKSKTFYINYHSTYGQSG